MCDTVISTCEYHLGHAINNLDKERGRNLKTDYNTRPEDIEVRARLRAIARRGHCGFGTRLNDLSNEEGLRLLPVGGRSVEVRVKLSNNNRFVGKVGKAHPLISKVVIS